MLNNLRKRPVLAKIISNASWMMAEQFSRLLIALFVGIWMARYLGPDDFGRLSAAIAYAGIFSIVAKLGLDRIAVRELVQSAEGGGNYPLGLVATLWTLRISAGVVCYVVCVAVVYFLGSGDLWIVAIIALSTVFSATDCIDLLFQARVASRGAVLARSVAIFTTLGIKVILLVCKAPLSSFVWVSLLDFAATSLSLVLVYEARFGIPLRIRIDWPLAGRLLRESWPEILAGFSALIMIRMDQVMLRALAGPREAGIFAVAARLSEAWYFVPLALVSSTFPRIVQYRTENPALYLKRIQHLMVALTALSYLVILLTQILAKHVVVRLFGPEYEESAQILVIHIWSSLLISFGFACGSWIVAERRVQLNLYRNLAGAVSNICLNFILIPRYGAIGAAYATLAGLIVSNIFFDYFCAPLRPLNLLKMRALCLIYR